MELNICLSDDDLEINKPARPTSAITDYSPKQENTRWYMDQKEQSNLQERSPAELQFTAQKLFLEGKWEQALAAYKHVLTLCGRNASSQREYLDSCMRCLLKLKRPAEAEQLLARSRQLAVSRDHTLVWRQLASDVYHQLGEPDRALRLRQAVVAADEQNPLAWLSLAETYGALAKKGECPHRSRNLQLWALLWARVNLTEVRRAARGCVAEAVQRRLELVNGQLEGAPFVTDELCYRLRHAITGLSGSATETDEEFVDRASSKFREQQDTPCTESDDALCEQFEYKWFDRFM